MKLVREFRRWPDGRPVTIDGIQRMSWRVAPEGWNPPAHAVVVEVAELRRALRLFERTASGRRGRS